VKSIKALGLGLLAAIAAMAIFGAGTASASTLYVSLCKKAELVCALANQYPAGTVIKGKLKTGTKSVLSGSLKVECSESEVSLETKAALSHGSLLGVFKELTFNDCTTCPIITSLVGSFGEPHLKNLGGLKGLLTVLSPLIHMDSCFGITKCTVTATIVELDVDTSVTPPVIKAVNEGLAVSGFGCGTEGKWSAEYVLTAPTPLFIES
jgi:hypothetical protein